MNVSRTLLTVLAALGLSTASAATYTVKTGDTLASIAQNNKIDQVALMTLNGLQSSTVAVGQVLKTSGFAQAGPVAPVTTPAKPEANLTPAASGGAFINTAASRYLGIRYVHGGTGGGGIDCSGYTMRVFQQLGIRLPRTAAAQFRTGTPVNSRNLRAGDLVFFNTMGSVASHVGIYLGNGMMANANSFYGKTMIEPLFSNPYWANRYTGARRVMS